MRGGNVSRYTIPDMTMVGCTNPSKSPRQVKGLGFHVGGNLLNYSEAQGYYNTALARTTHDLSSNILGRGPGEVQKFRRYTIPDVALPKSSLLPHPTPGLWVQFPRFMAIPRVLRDQNPGPDGNAPERSRLSSKSVFGISTLHGNPLEAMGKWKAKSRVLTDEEKAKYQYDEDAKTIICTACQETISLGKGGIENYETQHLPSKKCQKAKDALSKPKKSVPKPPAAASSLGSILGFMVPKPLRVPTLASAPSQSLPLSLPSPLSLQAPPVPEDLQPALVAQSSVNSASATNHFKSTVARSLKTLADNLLSSIPEADSTSAVAIFAKDPRAFDNPELDSEELWQEVINGVLKGVLGWNTDLPVDDVIRRGKHGVGGLAEFVEYFVIQRNVPEALFEGKLNVLMEEMKQRQNNPTGLPESNTAAAEAVLSPLSHNPNNPIIVDENLGTNEAAGDDASDGLEIVLYTPSMPKKRSHQCSGLKVEVPAGKTHHSAYPFALHEKLPLPWDYSSQRGSLYLTSFDCTRKVESESFPCKPCASLRRNPTLQGILDRMNNGTHKNATYAYRGHSELVASLQTEIQHNQDLRFRALNNARTILRNSVALSNMNRLIVAIGTEDVARVDQVIKVGLRQKKGMVGILEQVMAAARGVYKVRSFTDEEREVATLLWRIGGDRVGHILHRALGLPGVSTLRNGSARIPLTPSAGKPTIDVVARNTMSSLENVLALLNERRTTHHAVLMFDEIACEKRIRWNQRTDEIIGLCRAHGDKVSLTFGTVDDIDEAFKAVDTGEVHCAADATVAAVGILCEDHRIYAARPILISGDCKKESGPEHAKNVLQVTLDAVNSCRAKTNIRVTSIASDGESRRHVALVQTTFKKKLEPTSDIYPLLAPLKLLDLHVGDDDLTCDKDWKHVIKRVRNLLLRDRGVLVDDFRITPSVIRSHLQSIPETKTEHVNSVLNPDDLQDVKLAFNLLRDIWTLPPLPPLPNSSNAVTPGFRQGREALDILGKLMRHIVIAYLGVELNLSEQLEHLSAAAHLLFVLYKVGGKSFIPTLLYIDIIIMIKNVFFCVAKAKADNPDSAFFIIHLGTDRLEIQFGVLRTVVGNDCNLDILQISERAMGVLDIADILAKHPDWDKGPKRLQLPALTRNAEPIPDSADHLSPKYLSGNYAVKNVTPHTCWRVGRQMAESEYPPAAAILKKADETNGVDMLAPDGVLLVTAHLPQDDIDESSEALALDSATGTASIDNEPSELQDPAERNRIEIEDELAELDACITNDDGAREPGQSTPNRRNERKIERTLIFDGKPTTKSRILSAFSRYRKRVQSADRLKRVQEIARYSAQDDAASPSFANETEILLIHDPVAVLVQSDQRLWLAIGEVNGIRYNNQALERVGHSLLREGALKISLQVLGLREAILDDDSTGNYDWRTYMMPSESLTVPARFIEPLDPKTASVDVKSFYMFTTPFLLAQTSLLVQRMSPGDLAVIPKYKRTLQYPYRERWGKACFLAQPETNGEELTSLEPSSCSLCTPTVTLDTSAPRIIEHVSAHALFDNALDQADEPCGMCGLPARQCRYVVVKGKGSKASNRVDWKRTSGCGRPVNFSYKRAAEYSDNSPCTNVPLVCPLCPKEDPAVWRYNFKHHLQQKHTPEAVERYELLWKISDDEMAGMKRIWKDRRKSKPVTKKRTEPLLTVSEGHRSIAALQGASPSVPIELGLESDSEEDKDEMEGQGSSWSEDEEDGNGDITLHDSFGDEFPLNNAFDDAASGFDAQPSASSDARDGRQPEGGDMVASNEGNGEEDDGELRGESSAMGADSEAAVSIGGAAAEGPTAMSAIPAVEGIPGCGPVDQAPGGDVEEEETGRGRRVKKRTSNALANSCLCDCGTAVEPGSKDSVKCKGRGCETQWYHKACVEYAPQDKNWKLISSRGCATPPILPWIHPRGCRTRRTPDQPKQSKDG
ncbi:hypothetical protein DFP72DRAFT_1047213 [Ephemerocybe angulata]|uniref:Zinc finger PHD-type domain-containing protein n=1 Tax=Ephemerocybe angulata TaxID=980116 RepID=A0A8H6HU96_9AGAR|nr:hypothetical protein DFP72DRAFT_1047213 [Tulosesus angulatus]